MNININYKYRIYPNRNQREYFAKCFGHCRYLWNQILYICKCEGTSNLMKLTPTTFKENAPFLREVDSTMLANVHQNIKKAFKNFFEKRAQFPKYKSKKFSKNSCTSSNVNNNIRIDGTYLKMPKIGYIKIKLHRPLPTNATIKTCTIIKTSTNQYYATLSIIYENRVSLIILRNFVGIDYSSHDLFVDSNGNTANYPRYFRKYEKSLALQQQKLSLKKKGSKNYEKQRIRIAKVHEKIANSRKDFLHKKSHEIVKNFDAVVVEDIDLRNMAQSLKLGKSSNDNGFGMLHNMINYKLLLNGKPAIIKINKRFPSSQLCSNCGYKNSITKDLSVREYTCPKCGAHHNRDINAAINIKNEGIRMYFGEYLKPVPMDQRNLMLWSTLTVNPVTR